MQDWSWFRTTGQSGTGWGSSAAEMASFARIPLTRPTSVINEAKHRVLQRLPEHMCSWRAVGLGWGAGSPGGPAPHLGPSSLQQDAPGLRGEVICLRLRQRHTACTVTLHKLNYTRSGRERGEECNSLNATGHSGYHLTEGVSLREQVGPCASL